MAMVEDMDVPGARTRTRGIDTTVGGSDVAVPVLKRISWPAVFAGAVITLVVQLTLSVLGLGIGASTIDPRAEQNPVSSVGLGAGIWFIASTLVALLAGGYVAGRLAGVFRKADGLLHGLLVWGSSTLLTFYLLTTTVGGLIGGVAGILGRGIDSVGREVAAAVPQGAMPGGIQAPAAEQPPAMNAGERALPRGPEAERRAREAGDVAARGVAKASLWTFFALLISAAAAAAGGYIGTPRRPDALRAATVS